MKPVNFLKEVKMEIQKINWPTRDQTVRYTLIVIGISTVIAAFLGGMDFIFTSVLDKFILLR
ncbi:MAG: preprotein translocase subunit SecE [Candidatus Nealsonbacteria bacterium]|nr:preprotein translocase subunit SecE [Candidatus Nealsonbacteria bacterium]